MPRGRVPINASRKKGEAMRRKRRRRKRKKEQNDLITNILENKQSGDAFSYRYRSKRKSPHGKILKGESSHQHHEPEGGVAGGGEEMNLLIKGKGGNKTQEKGKRI